MMKLVSASLNVFAHFVYYCASVDTVGGSVLSSIDSTCFDLQGSLTLRPAGCWHEISSMFNMPFDCTDPLICDETGEPKCIPWNVIFAHDTSQTIRDSTRRPATDKIKMQDAYLNLFFNVFPALSGHFYSYIAFASRAREIVSGETDPVLFKQKALGFSTSREFNSDFFVGTNRGWTVTSQVFPAISELLLNESSPVSNLNRTLIILMSDGHPENPDGTDELSATKRAVNNFRASFSDNLIHIHCLVMRFDSQKAQPFWLNEDVCDSKELITKLSGIVEDNGAESPEEKMKDNLQYWSNLTAHCQENITTSFFMQGNTFPATNGQTSNMNSQSNTQPSDVVCGAIQAVLADPINPDVCIAGATNGGVWRTTSCTDAEPIWEPLTDKEESLSVGDMVYDLDDNSRNTVLVGIGGRSSFFRIGGQEIGLLLTENILSSSPAWQVLDNAAGSINFRNQKVEFNSVFARGNLFIASAFRSNGTTCENKGIFRSTDRGLTWTRVIPGVGRAIVSDPNNADVFYATVDNVETCSMTSGITNKVFVSMDSGATWDPTAAIPSTMPIPDGELNNAKLSVSADRSRVWSALLKNGVADSISYSDDFGVSWIRMDDVLTPGTFGNVGLNPRVKPGSQGSIHFSLLASPVNRDIVYVAGDRQDCCFPNFIGAEDFTGRLFRGNAAIAPAGSIPSPQWDHMTDINTIAEIPGGGTASSSGPHADGRDMEIRADGFILEADDGGIAVRSSPDSNTGDWFGVCGNLQVFETHNVAYEPILKTIIFGNQDTGTIFGTLGERGTFDSLFTADGNDCMIDYTTDAGNSIFYYYGTQFYTRFFRATFDISSRSFTAFDNVFLPKQANFVSIATMNPSNQATFAVSSIENFIMLTRDGGATFTTLDFGFGEITAMIWSSTGDILYVAEGNRIHVCDFSGTGIPNVTSCIANAINIVARLIRHLAVDPSNNDNVFAAVANFDGSSPAVFAIDDTDLTVSNSLLETAARGSAVAFIRKDAGVSFLAVGTSNGVLIPDENGLGNGWKLGAPGLPTVQVMDMVYEALDDTLVLSTLGRGVWFLNNASMVFDGTAAGNWMNSNPKAPMAAGAPFSKPPPRTVKHKNLREHKRHTVSMAPDTM